MRKSAQSGEKQPSKVWAIVNSSIFIWLLTTVVVGIASSLWTKRLECREEFKEAEYRFADALIEYQFRQRSYVEARKAARTPKEKEEADKWWTAYVATSISTFQSKTMADVALDMLRSFGKLAVVSDMESFDVKHNSLLFNRSNGKSDHLDLSEPSSEALAAIGKQLSEKHPEFVNSISVNKEPPVISSDDLTTVNKFRARLQGDDLVLGAVRTAAMLRPQPRCSISDVFSRMFVDTNAKYEAQVRRLFGAIYNEYNQQMIELITIEELSKSISKKN